MPGPGHHLQVIGEDRTPEIALEPFLTLPVTTVHAEDAFQRRDVRFDAGSEVLQPFVDLGTLYHIDDSETALLCEN